ncbi:nucleotidyltransferase domain-containing protein [Olivibacter sitiensis]|uniref:nucleotidyltransferase domain-containing protein n=1 Tax=Olivibacter sitiensis TaxID=376470 RepID=UPI00040B593B|nr:nucleotidyltransferase domain-containing protein [Olivibacter sitiensis]
MRQQIDNLFKDIDERPLFYIESGSRLWGIASPDSDFDVRGFHFQSKRQYFDFKKHRYIIEVMDGDFDFVSYDIDKMFELLVKSNPTVFEWVRANIVYFNELPDWTALQQDVITNFDFKALFHHYISLAKGNINLMETGKKFTYKTAFYCIRGLLSADLATRQIIPQLLIDDLFKQFDNDNEVLKIAKDSLERKKQQAEKEEVLENDKQKILTAIKDFTKQLEIKAPDSSNNRQKLESILTDYSYNLKTRFYGR